MPGDNEPITDIFLQRANGYGEPGNLNWVSAHWFMIDEIPKNFIGFKIKSSVIIELITVKINYKAVIIKPNDYECCIFVDNGDEFKSNNIDNICVITPESYWLSYPMEIWFICGER